MKKQLYIFVLLFFPCFIDAQNVGIGISNPTAKLDVNGNIKLEGLSMFEFGAGVAGKEVNAGKIGYNAFGYNALTFIGAGTTNANRAFHFFGEGGTVFEGSVGIIGSMNITGKLEINSNSGTAGQILQSNGSSVAPTWVNPGNNQYNNTFIDYLPNNTAVSNAGGSVTMLTRNITLTANALVSVTTISKIFGNPAVGLMQTTISIPAQLTGGHHSSAYFQSTDATFGTANDKLVVKLPAGNYVISMGVGPQTPSASFTVLGIGSILGNPTYGARMITEIVYQ